MPHGADPPTTSTPAGLIELLAPGPGPGRPAGLSAVVGVGSPLTWGVREVRADPPLAGVLVAATALAVIQAGLLSPGTTVRECIAARDLPAGADPAAAVGGLLAAIGSTAPRAGWRPTPPAALLHRIVEVACAEPMASVADGLVLGPAGMAATRCVDGSWCTTPADLRRLAAGDRWPALARAGALVEVGPRVGVRGQVSAWRYPTAGVVLAMAGRGDAVLAALDHAVGTGDGR